MDDTAQQFFAQPTQTYHRRYEALRAVFVDGRSQKEVAEQFGFTYGTMRQLVLEFRQVCDDPAQSSDALFFERSENELRRRPPRTRHFPSRQSPTGGS